MNTIFAATNTGSKGHLAGKLDLGRGSGRGADKGGHNINEDSLAEKLLTTLRAELSQTVREALAAPTTSGSPELQALMDRTFAGRARGRPADDEGQRASAAEVAALRSEVSELCVLVTRGNELMRDEMKDMWTQVIGLLRRVAPKREGSPRSGSPRSGGPSRGSPRSSPRRLPYGDDDRGDGNGGRDL